MATSGEVCKILSIGNMQTLHAMAARTGIIPTEKRIGKQCSLMYTVTQIEALAKERGVPLPDEVVLRSTSALGSPRLTILKLIPD